MRYEALGKLIHIKHGYAFKSEYFSLDTGTQVVLTPGNFYEEGGFKLRPDKDRFYTGNFPKEFVLKKNDLIIAMTEQTYGLLGSPALIPADDRYLHNQRLGKFELLDRKRACLRYLYHLFCLKSLRDEISVSATGTKIRHTAPERIYKLKVPLPPLPIQRKIAAVLSAYDDQIENNNRRIAILEKMAEELYREWFVCLRFPGHEKVRIVKGVPEGWEVKRFGDIANITMGQSPKSEFYNTSGEGLPFNQGVGTYGRRFPRKEIFCNSPGKLANSGDILFSVRAPVGRLNIADCKMIIGRGLAAINHKERCNSYLYYLLKSAFSEEDIIGNGAIFNAVGKDELTGFKFICPDMVATKTFNDSANKLDQQIICIIRANDLLRRSRNMLLSRLMSGKIDVERLDIKFPASMMEEGNA